MHSSFLAKFLVLLGVFSFAAAATGPNIPGAKLEIRQDSGAPSTGPQSQRCIDYEYIANMSTIGANGSYRTVLMQKSNVGTIYNARMMDAAIAALPPLMMNEDLNAECQNKTEIALREAERNFTQGIVAQFTTEGLPVGIKAGPEVIAVCIVISALMSGVWIFSG